MDFALHRYGDRYFQEATYYSLFGACVLFAAAVACGFIPWEQQALFGLKVKYLIALIPGWGGICLLGFHVVRILAEQRIIVSPHEATLTIQKAGHDTVVAWPDILVIQICEGSQEVAEEVEARFGLESHYQLILAYRDSTGVIRRHCLAAHFAKSSCTRLARQYSNLFGFQVVEHLAHRDLSLK